MLYNHSPDRKPQKCWSLQMNLYMKVTHRWHLLSSMIWQHHHSYCLSTRATVLVSEHFLGVTTTWRCCANESQSVFSDSWRSPARWTKSDTLWAKWECSTWKLVYGLNGKICTWSKENIYKCIIWGGVN